MMNKQSSHPANPSKKKGFVLYQDFFPMIMMLSVTQRGHLITAIFEYHDTGTVSQPMKGALAVAFESIRATLDRDGEAYAERCRRMSENGKRGGRPKKAFTEETLQTDEPIIKKNQKLLKKADIDKDKDKDRDRDRDRDRDIDIDIDIDREEELPKETPPPLPEGAREEREELERIGIPIAYAEERWARAEVFARSQKKRVTEVLSDWWQTDQHKTPKNQPSSYSKSSSNSYSKSYSSDSSDSSSPPSSSPPREKSYDVDEFIAAALRRSEEEQRILSEQDRLRHK